MKIYEITILSFTVIFAVWYLLKGMILSHYQEPEPGTRKSCILGGVLAVLAVAEYLIFSKGV